MWPKTKKEAALYRKAEEVYHVFHEKCRLLDRLKVSELQDIVRFLGCNESKGQRRQLFEAQRERKEAKGGD